jgi:hypothetical protein
MLTTGVCRERERECDKKITLIIHQINPSFSEFKHSDFEAGLWYFFLGGSEDGEVSQF